MDEKKIETPEISSEEVREATVVEPGTLRELGVEEVSLDAAKKSEETAQDKIYEKGVRRGILWGVLGSFAMLAGLILGFGLATNFQFGLTSNTSSSTGSSGTAITISGDGILTTSLINEINTIEAYLELYELYDVDLDALRKGILTGLIGAVDDAYADYYDVDELQTYMDSAEGEYVGIGAAVSQNLSTGVITVTKPYAGTPAAEAGLLPGDMIVAVDGTEVTGIDLNKVVTMIKGDEGTGVELTMYREGEGYFTVTVIRSTIVIPTVNYEMLEQNIGYIEVTGFEGVTADQFIAAYEDLKEQGMEYVIVDLRNNTGGLVSTVEAMLDYLLPEGTIFYVKYKDGTKSMEYVSDAETALDIPMAILVNEYTASASEVFAGNIQAFGLGTVVGVTTYGKGVMQQLFYTTTSYNTAVKLTVADYYIYSDINVNGVGVTPDVEVELAEGLSSLLTIPHEDDNQLQAAVEALLGQ